MFKSTSYDAASDVVHFFFNPSLLYSSFSLCHFIELIVFYRNVLFFSFQGMFSLLTHDGIYYNKLVFLSSLILDSNYMKPILSVVAVAIELSITLGCVMSLKNKSQAVRCNLLTIYVHYFDNV
jgi:hypothetical protein